MSQKTSIKKIVLIGAREFCNNYLKIKVPNGSFFVLEAKKIKNYLSFKKYFFCHFIDY
jgi:hypothetical protein